MGRSLPRLVTWLLAVAAVLVVVSAFVSRTYCFPFLLASTVPDLASGRRDDAELFRWLSPKGAASAATRYVLGRWWPGPERVAGCSRLVSAGV